LYKQEEGGGIEMGNKEDKRVAFVFQKGHSFFAVDMQRFASPQRTLERGINTQESRTLGLPLRAKPVLVVLLSEFVSTKDGTRAWDQHGGAWFLRDTPNNFLWECDPEHDRSQIAK